MVAAIVHQYNRTKVCVCVRGFFLFAKMNDGREGANFGGTGFATFLDDDGGDDDGCNECKNKNKRSRKWAR